AVRLPSKRVPQSYPGTAWDYLRTAPRDANPSPQSRAGQRKTTFQRNQFGANLSGPIWKSKKLYFFGGYDGDREGSPAPFLATVPTTLQRQGDFSQTLNANGSLSVIYNPFTTRPNPSGAGFIRDPFPNNRVPNNLF